MAIRQDELNLRARTVERFYLRRRRVDVEVARRLVARHLSAALAWLALADARLARGETAEAREASDRARSLGWDDAEGAPATPHAARPY